MNSKSKLGAIAILAAVGVATPATAFAQELQTGTAANREQLFGNGSPGYVPYYGRQASGAGAHAEVRSSPFLTRRGGHFRRHYRSY